MRIIVEVDGGISGNMAMHGDGGTSIIIFFLGGGGGHGTMEGGKK